VVATANPFFRFGVGSSPCHPVPSHSQICPPTRLVIPSGVLYYCAVSRLSRAFLPVFFLTVRLLKRRGMFRWPALQKVRVERGRFQGREWKS
jgi:hypothetical protein